MSVKTFKTLDEQIEILKRKGLIINNEDFAKDVLLRENYFFLNGYRYPFVKSRNEKIYIGSTTFEELYSLFLFDRKLRNVLFKNILLIENNLKSIISYQLSKKYGYREKEYLSLENFDINREKKRQVKDLINKMKRQIKNNAPVHSATKHYLDNYGYIPLWVLVKVLSFGVVSELFDILKKEDRDVILDIYDIDFKSFSIYLDLLANYRNLCAHEDIVYENRTQKYIDGTKYHELLGIEKIDDKYVSGTNDLFALMIIFKKVLKKEEFDLLVDEINFLIEDLDYNLKSIPISKVLDRMGFPNNWKELKEI